MHRNEDTRCREVNGENYEHQVQRQTRWRNQVSGEERIKASEPRKPQSRGHQVSELRVKSRKASWSIRGGQTVRLREIVSACAGEFRCGVYCSQGDWFEVGLIEARIQPVFDPQPSIGRSGTWCNLSGKGIAFGQRTWCVRGWLGRGGMHQVQGKLKGERSASDH